MARGAPPEEDDGPAADRPMTLGQHLEELRRRVLRSVLYAAAAFLLAFAFEDEIVAIVLEPYWDVLRRLAKSSIQVTEVTEAILGRMWLFFVLALFAAGPFILLEVWGFVARGLYEREKRAVRVFAPISLFLFAEGCLFYYFVIQPPMLEQLLTYGVDVPLYGGALHEQIEVNLRFENAIRTFLILSLVMGLVFQLPLVMVFVQKIGLANWRTYSSHRRHFFVANLVAMAILTPTTDAVTLLIFMLPVTVLFEGGVIVCWLMDPKAPKETDDG